MNRSAPLGRGKPLDRGSKPLSRGTGLPRGTGPARKPPAPRTAPSRRDGTGEPPPPRRSRPRPANTGPDSATRALVHKRDGGRCVRCGAPATNQHHREGRGMGGRKGEARARTNGPAYLLDLCGSGTAGCHGWVESNREQARQLGYLLRRNAETDPALIPVRTAAGWEMFGHDGSRATVPPPPREDDPA